ncbi:hypothetical protein KCP70_19780 [Salmonella enterica subsp. enterica]|nr:hypothetical protein KCP70_19780 [Salmonella enterica subsp. enterica]
MRGGVGLTVGHLSFARAIGQDGRGPTVGMFALRDGLDALVAVFEAVDRRLTDVPDIACGERAVSRRGVTPTTPG